jgi:hypothetical protein
MTQQQNMQNACQKQARPQGDGPKLTLQDINAAIVDVAYHRFPGTTLTVCCLTLRNGYTVTGESACVSPENFDEGVGRRYAFDDAQRKVWNLEGYLLKERMSQPPMAVTVTVGYAEPPTMKFGEAIEAMRNGYTVKRKGWDDFSGKNLSMMQWAPGQLDMLADDWVVVHTP